MVQTIRERGIFGILLQPHKKSRHVSVMSWQGGVRWSWLVWSGEEEGDKVK